MERLLKINREFAEFSGISWRALPHRPWPYEYIIFPWKFFPLAYGAREALRLPFACLLRCDFGQEILTLLIFVKFRMHPFLPHLSEQIFDYTDIDARVNTFLLSD
jgi:hypothetical protein